MNDIITETFQFEMKTIPESMMDLIRKHNAKIIDITGYAAQDLYNDAIVSSIDLDLEGDIGNLNKLAIELNAVTDKYGYVIK